MGRIVSSVSIRNALAPEHRLRCDALVDTGASHMVLPAAWRERLGPLQEIGEGSFETATGATIRGAICGPVTVEVEGFRPIFTEVVFLEMEPRSGEYDPLLGYVVLEMCQAAVDMVGHRLVPVKHLDLKRGGVSPR